MPRTGRIQLVGKREARERQTREAELRRLARRLRREWRDHVAGGHSDAVDIEMGAD